MSTIKLDWEEAKEIADVLTKTENPDEDYSITENALADKWNISLEDFHEIVDGIFRMIDFGISPLYQTPYVGISKGNEWLAKKKVDQQFMASIISWLTEGKNKIKKNSKGFIRIIEANGKPEFEISITRPIIRSKWIKIETADDLPNEDCLCWIIDKQRGLVSANWVNAPYGKIDQETRKFWVEKASHYQVIEKPELP